jgi:hypothetical protein
MFWAYEDIELLKTLWEEDKLSTAEIGHELKMSKNAVIGKAHRLGLTRKSNAPRAHGQPKPRGPRVRTAPRVQVNGFIMRTLPPKAVPLASPSGDGIHITDLEQHHCRAITGTGADGLARYCGETKRYADSFSPGESIYRGSFCEFHARAYYQPLYR